MKKVEKTIWGVLFIIIGVIVLLNSLEITDINIFFEGWWTLVIIIPSFIGLIKDEDKVWSIFFLILGIVLLLSARNILDMALIAKLILPAILIVIGFNIIFKDKLNSKVNEKIKELDNKDIKEYYATFAGQELNFANEEFTGAKLNAIFGGIDLDLSQAKIQKDIVLDVCAVFGGVDIKVPENVDIKVQSNSIFGGVSNKSKTKEKTHTIYIKAMCLFGGCDIK